MPDKAELVKLRYFAGLDEATAAETLHLPRHRIPLVDFLTGMAVSEVVGARLDSQAEPSAREFRQFSAG